MSDVHFSELFQPIFSFLPVIKSVYSGISSAAKGPIWGGGLGEGVVDAFLGFCLLAPPSSHFPALYPPLSQGLLSLCEMLYY